jgi:nucleoside phosphorylase
MSKEMEFFPQAVPYFRDFVKANLTDFYEHMREFRTYPEGGYGSFYRDNEVMQVLINIYHNIVESFGDLKIPETFASPKALARAWNSFHIFLKNDDKLFNDVYTKLGNKDEDFPFPIVLTIIDNDRRKVIDLLEHILSLDEVKQYLDDNAKIEVQADKVKYTIAPIRVFDVVIITAIYKEYEQVIPLLQNGLTPTFKDPSRTIYFQGELQTNSQKTIKVLVACANQMGMTSAASLASKLISRFQPRVVSMVGIAAGISGEIGDVMIPDIVWDYGSGKSSLIEKKNWWGRKIDVEEFTPYRFPITTKQDLIGQLIRIAKETNINESVFNLGNQISFENKPQKLKSHIGPFVSGSAVIANDNILSQIKSQDGKLIGFDMEAFAIAYSCSVSDITPQPISIILKSISDYGNKKKQHIDKDEHQKYAAFTSANYLILLLTQHSEIFDLN